MAGFTAGNMKRWAFVPEATYGTTPATALTYGGAVLKLTPKVNPDTEFIYLGDTPDYTQVTRGPYKVGYSLEYYAHQDSGAYYWYNFATVYAMGASKALADTLPSFTSSFRKYVGTTNYYQVFNGSKINSTTWRFGKVGKPIIFKDDVVSQFITLLSNKTGTGIQHGVTIGADPTDISTNLLCRTGVSQINLGGGGLTNWYPELFEITIGRELDPVPGSKVVNSVDYPLDSIALDEGPRTISATAEVRYANSTYTAAKQAGTPITAITIPCGNQTITLSNGDFIGDDHPDETQNIRDETIKMRFKTMTMA